MSIEKYLDVSTACLPYSEWTAMTDGEDRPDGLILTEHEYGVWVWVPPADHLFGDYPELIAQYPRLAAIMDYARQNGCNWINFDMDSNSYVPGLPAFDWEDGDRITNG